MLLISLDDVISPLSVELDMLFIGFEVNCVLGVHLLLCVQCALLNPKSVHLRAECQYVIQRLPCTLFSN